MYRSILVPLDGSDFGEYAIPYATAIARACDAHLDLVHVHIPAPPAETLTGLTPYRFQSAPDYAARDDALEIAREESYLERLAARLRDVNGVRTSFRVLDGSVENALLHEVDRATCDLVVMTTHARGMLARLWLGGVAHDLVDHVKIPVLLVPAIPKGFDITAEKQLNKLLVTLDGSALAEQVLDPAIELVDSLGSHMTVLSVVSAVGHHLVPTPAHPRDRSEQRASLDMPEYLAGIVAELTASGISAELRVSVHNDPAWAILDVAATHEMDAIAIATHGRSGLSRLIFGSVADHVVEKSTIPVLVHRPENTLEVFDGVHDVPAEEAWNATQESLGL